MAKEMKQFLKWALILGVPLFLGLLVYRAQIDSRSSSGEQNEAFQKAPELWWKDLYALDPKQSIVPESLLVFDEKTVRIPGFVVPLEDNLRQVREFLLVPDGMACIHVPPPPPNQIVMVRSQKPLPIESLQGPMWVMGKFQIRESKSQYGKSSFELEAVSVTPYQ